jgi:hypothetical protein
MPVRSIEDPDSPLLLQISHFRQLCYTSAKFTIHSIGPGADNSDNIFSARGSTLQYLRRRELFARVVTDNYDTCNILNYFDFTGIGPFDSSDW